MDIQHPGLMGFARFGVARCRCFEFGPTDAWKNAKAYPRTRRRGRVLRCPWRRTTCAWPPQVVCFPCLSIQCHQLNWYVETCRNCRKWWDYNRSSLETRAFLGDLARRTRQSGWSEFFAILFHIYLLHRRAMGNWPLRTLFELFFREAMAHQSYISEECCHACVYRCLQYGICKNSCVRQ